MRLLLAATILLTFSCTSTQPTVTRQQNPDASRKSAPPKQATSQPSAIEHLRKLKPRIQSLVAQLGSSDYRTREKAKVDLREIGLPAVPALEEAVESPDPEVSHAAAELAESLKPKVKRLIVVKDRRSEPDQVLQLRLEQANLASLPAKGRLSEFVKFLRTKARVNVFVHPDLAAENPQIEVGEVEGALPALLECIAEKLDASWVARFSVLYLAKPETALELAGAEVLTAESREDKMRLSAKTWHGTTMSLTKETSLTDILNWFSQIRKFKFVLSDQVNPNAKISCFQIKEVRLRDALSLVLFSMGLTGKFKEMQVTLSKGNYKHLSRDLREKRSRLLEYREAWENLRKASK